MYVISTFYDASISHRLSTNFEPNNREEHTKTHIGCTPTVHIRTRLIHRSQPKIGQFHDDLSLLLDDLLAILQSELVDPCIGDDKVLRFDIPVEHLLFVAGSDGITHLREHARDETEPCMRKEMTGMQRTEERGCWRGVR